MLEMNVNKMTDVEKERAWAELIDELKSIVHNPCPPKGDSNI